MGNLSLFSFLVFCSALGVMFLFLVGVILKLTRARVVEQAAPVEAAVEV